MRLRSDLMPASSRCGRVCVRCPCAGRAPPWCRRPPATACRIPRRHRLRATRWRRRRPGMPESGTARGSGGHTGRKAIRRVPVPSARAVRRRLWHAPRGCSARAVRRAFACDLAATASAMRAYSALRSATTLRYSGLSCGPARRIPAHRRVSRPRYPGGRFRSPRPAISSMRWRWWRIWRRNGCARRIALLCRGDDFEAARADGDFAGSERSAI